MNPRILLKDIGIVVVASFNKEICNPLWLYKHNILSIDDIQSIDNNSTIVSKELVQFRTPIYELICDDSRLQIRSKDVSMSNKLSGIVKSIIACNSARVNAIGINSMLRVAFKNEVDFLRFNHHIAPLDGLNPLSPNALLANITVSDWSEQMGEGVAKKTFEIQRLPNFQDHIPSIQISMNAHYDIMNEGNIADILENAAKVHSDFFCNAHLLFESINE